MAFADHVPNITFGVMLVCWIVLLIYVGRVLRFILWSCDEHRRMREAMAVGYTAVAAWFTATATTALPNFVQRVVGDAGSVGSTTSEIYAVLVICSLIIFVAFICNFSRSLWMLKTLDHAVFEPVPDWEKLSEPKRKRTFEFVARMFAALLFILFELQLEKVAHSQASQQIDHASQGLIPTEPLSRAAGVGILLYLVLIFWWLSGLWIARSKMPKLLLLFFSFGLFNSIFIYVFGAEPVNESRKVWLLIFVGIMALFAGYMIFFVLQDFFRPLGPPLKKLFRYFRPLREIKAGQIDS